MDTTTLTVLLNSDFCPWANRYVYWLKTPLGILIVAAIASLLCGLWVAPQGLVIAGTIAATIILGIVWPWIGLWGLSCELRFPHQRGLEGQVSPVEVIVTNRWPFPVWGLAIEEGFFLARDVQDGTAVALSGIRGWSKAKFCWNFQPECRGVYPATNVKIATEFPFGVWKARRDVVTTGQIVIWPKTVSLEPAVLVDGANRSLLRASDKRCGSEGERIGVRAYREGDSLRFVHWAQTAKCGRLIVSERQGPAQSSVVVAIDTDYAISHGSGSYSSFEASIRIAASLCEQLTRQNVTVLLVANDASWEIQPSNVSRRRSMDRMASLSRTRPLDLAGFDKHDERFVITTSAQGRNWGPKWKAIVLADTQGQSGHLVLDRPADWPIAWIVIDSSSNSLPQFAQRWAKRVHYAWRGTARQRVGVAS